MKLRNIIMALLLMFMIGLSGCGLFNQNKGLELQGNCYENLKNFSDYSEDMEVSELSGAYLSAIDYEITEINKDEMTVIMDVKIPLVAETLSDIIHSIVVSNSGAPYDDLRIKIQEELIAKLSSGEMDVEDATIELPIQEENGKYEIVSTDEWTELIYGNLTRAYIEVFSRIGGDYE